MNEDSLTMIAYNDVSVNAVVNAMCGEKGMNLTYRNSHKAGDTLVETVIFEKLFWRTGLTTSLVINFFEQSSLVVCELAACGGKAGFWQLDHGTGKSILKEAMITLGRYGFSERR